MPKLDKLNIPRNLDRRVKITDKDKKDIRQLHNQGLGIREIARQYQGKASRRSIQFILYPERYEKAKQQFKERRLDGRYKATTEERRHIMREHRAYKRSLLDKGLVKHEKG